MCYSKVNGTTFREKEMGRPLPWDDMEEGHPLTLEREPHNAYDPNAIKILWKGTHIGYIPRNTAETVAKLIDDGKLNFWAVIDCITGGEKGKEQKGINIRIMYSKKEVN